jgi:hypothetical protein
MKFTTRKNRREVKRKRKRRGAEKKLKNEKLKRGYIF